MKKAFSILKYVCLAVILVGAIIGFLFFRAWQKDATPTVTKATWTEDNITLGHKTVLEVTLSAAWHRELISADPQGYPDSLPPVPNAATLKRGTLYPNGYRTWTAQIPLAATDIKSTDGLAIYLPLKATDRPSPRSVNIPLPKLTIHLPGNLPSIVSNPNDFILDDSQPEKKTAESEPASPWLAVVAIALALGLMIFFYLRNQTGGFRPPSWETALSDLQSLEQQSSLSHDAFFSRLTDILKSYTTERFQITATAKTSSEFLTSVYSLPDVPVVETMDLPWLAKLSDDVKFAGRTPDISDPTEALTLVRSFVIKTKPAPDPSTDA